MVEVGLGGEIRISHVLSGGRLETPKSGHGRTVDMSKELVRELLHLCDGLLGWATFAGASEVTVTPSGPRPASR